MLLTTKNTTELRPSALQYVWKQFVHVMWFSDSRFFEMFCVFLSVAFSGSILYFNYLRNDVYITQGKVVAGAFIISALLRTHSVIIAPNNKQHLKHRRTASLIEMFLWVFLAIEVNGGSIRYGYPQTLGIYLAGAGMNLLMWSRLHSNENNAH